MAQAHWAVPFRLHTRGHQSARTGVKLQWPLRMETSHTVHPTPPPHPASVMLAMAGSVTVGVSLFHPALPLTLSLALWQPDGQVGLLE